MSSHDSTENDGPDAKGGTGDTGGGGNGSGDGAGGNRKRREESAAVRLARALVAEVVGTALLILAGAGAPAVEALSGGHVGRVAAVTAPGLTVGALILAMGEVSGAHFNPAVTLAFAVRREFPWRHVPAYVVAQLLGAVGAAALIAGLLHAGTAKDVIPAVGLGLGAGAGLAIEAVLTFGLVTVILGTASGAQNVGHLSSLAVAAYVVLAGLWSSPLTGAAMNPARWFGPALVAGRWPDVATYLLGPLLGALAAVGVAVLLRGRGGDPTASHAAEGQS